MKTRHKIAVSVGHVSHNSVESWVVTNCVSIREMKQPDSSSNGVVPPQWDSHSRTKIKTHVQPASVGKWNIVSETHKTAVDVEEGLVAPLRAR